MDKYSFFYKIPDNWCWTKLGKITSIIGGGTPSSKIKEYYDNGNIAWITPSDLSNYNNIYISKGKKMITELGLMKSSAKLLPKGTVCLSSRAPIGYVAIAENELCTNQGFKSFLPSELYEPEYLYWYLKSIKHILEAKASGTTFLELSAKKAGEVEIPLPPINEQQRIVNIIESLFTKLDRAKELIENTLAQFEQNKMAILHKAFTGELTVKWRKENNIDLSSWKKCELKEVFKVVKDKYNPQTENQIVNYIGLENIETSKGII
ncbi:restriction endonuclease subunit S, partial [Megamonas funiformis]|uniref:restriction endonuclease subunit S n=1 Tax=Megamonas funiformis TaxID=437897 RepID=UPI0022E063FA